MTGLPVSGAVFTKAAPLTSLSTAEPRQLAHKSRKMNREDDNQETAEGREAFCLPAIDTLKFRKGWVR